MTKQRRGFALMDPDRQHAIAVKGGIAAHAVGTAHEWTGEEARQAGHKGGAESARRRAMRQDACDPSDCPSDPIAGH